MDRSERFYKIREMLRVRRAVPLQDFTAVLEVSVATFKRDLEYLRDRFGMAILWDRACRGYRLDPESPHHELPGLWFNSSEIHALLAMHHLLANLDAGLLAPHIKPLQVRIQALIEKDDHSFEEVARRIRVLPMAARRIESTCFQVIAHALLARRRLCLVHDHRQRNEETEREVSPQRLAHYRDNWYLDAWDHGKEALRVFSVDAIRQAAILNTKARNVPDKTLDAELGSGYGIFAGRKTQTAVLRFTLERARWITGEQWHPKQKGYEHDGAYILEVPYSHDTELVLDILRYGPDVEVLAPNSLRDKVMRLLHQALSQYQQPAQRITP
ncbi:MAG: helix-turn-helix transcriptional regulator [Acidiferrobacteraceae bacterium]